MALNSEVTKSINHLLEDPSKSVGVEIELKAFVILNILTLGLYQLFWGFYQFRQALIFPKHPRIGALISTLFLPLALSQLIEYYEVVATQLGDRLRLPLPRIPLAIVFFATALIQRLSDKIPEPLGTIVGFGAEITGIVILGFIQCEINRLNRQFRPERAVKAFTLTWKHIVGLIAGVISLIAILVAASLMNPGQ
ncbi:MAG: hypothetical protein K2Y32_07615 [Candidatus Obscuribacterales bacterium]|nr:hypothetical protein [Candidatus Obscuribacterales bacterium]